MDVKHDHIIINTGANGRLDCLHCGHSYQPALPCSINTLAGMMEGFQKDHARCELGPDGKACHFCMQFGHAPKDCKRLKVTSPMDWMHGPDTGISSKCIWHVMMGTLQQKDTCHPWDPDDFGRCYRLLKAFPQWRKRLPEVAKRFPRWTALVREWDTLTKLWEEESPSGRCPKLYKLMQTLIEESTP